MLSSPSLIQLLLCSAAAASPLLTRQNSTRQRVTWGECAEGFNGTLPTQCGNITVPLDYTNSTSGETLEIELLKVPATKQPSRGSIFFNFGGPGVGVRRSLATRGKLLHTITGGYHDLVGWDPRGTEQNLRFSCFENDTIRTLDSLAKGVSLGNASDTSLGRLWVAGQLSGGNCANYPGSAERGDLIGTAFTARDMMQMVDALDDDGLLRYWGSSYGTALGATVSALFPDRIDKVVLDGMLNPSEYFYGYDWEAWADTDATFSQFFQQCLLHRDECAIARENATAESLEKATWKLIDKIKYEPIVFRGGIFDYATLKVNIRGAMYAPARWPTLSRYLNGLLAGNMTQFLEANLELDANVPDALKGGVGNEAPFGIHCADKATRAATLEESKPAIHKFWDTSRLQGDTTNLLVLSCNQWPFHAKERYMDGFNNIKTKNPVLVVGNTYDPATPLRSAVNITAGFEGSVLLQQNSYGHCLSVQPSVCTAKAIKNYFLNGILPPPGTVCEPNYHPFSAKQTFDELFPEIEAA